MMKINITKRLNRFLAVAGAMLIGALPALAQESSLTRVAANDCGVPGAQPFLVKGENYTMPSMGHRTKRILRIERKEYQTY